jgi:hypothetical protein
MNNYIIEGYFNHSKNRNINSFPKTETGENPKKVPAKSPNFTRHFRDPKTLEHLHAWIDTLFELENAMQIRV